MVSVYIFMYDVRESPMWVWFVAIELSRLEEDLLKSPKEKLQCVINAVVIIMSILVNIVNERGSALFLHVLIMEGYGCSLAIVP